MPFASSLTPAVETSQARRHSFTNRGHNPWPAVHKHNCLGQFLTSPTRSTLAKSLRQQQVLSTPVRQSSSVSSSKVSHLDAITEVLDDPLQSKTLLHRCLCAAAATCCSLVKLYIVAYTLCLLQQQQPCCSHSMEGAEESGCRPQRNSVKHGNYGRHEGILGSRSHTG